MSSSEHLRDGQTFGRYQIVRMIGEGGMGSVYEAVHTGLKKRFAIKTLLPSIAQSTEAKARFLREGEAASRINHPNVVDISDVGTEEGVPYLVMEYFEGETLGDLIARKGSLDLALAVDLFVPVLSAVSAGHDQGVIHRDLKPHNIFLARGALGARVPKILDFGVSKLIGGENPALTGTLSVLGTASYMSPEQARGSKVVEARSDQYALGLILYEMLTGARAYFGDSPLEVLHKIATGSIVSPRTARPDIPVEVDAVVMKMLAMRAEDRYASLRDVGLALLPLASDGLRSTYQGGFNESGGAARATGAMPIAAAREGRPMALGAETGPTAHTPGVVAGGTQLLPRAAVDTTLGQGAAETQSRTAAPRTATRRVGFGLAIGAVAVVAILAVRSGGSRPTAAVEHGPPAAGTSAVAAPAAAELPSRQPPAAPAPEPAPPPASVPSPPPVSPPVGAATEGARPARPSPDAHDHGKQGSRHRAKTPSPAVSPVAPTSPTSRRGANNAPILE